MEAKVREIEGKGDQYVLSLSSPFWTHGFTSSAYVRASGTQQPPKTCAIHSVQLSPISLSIQEFPSRQPSFPLYSIGRTLLWFGIQRNLVESNPST